MNLASPLSLLGQMGGGNGGRSAIGSGSGAGVGSGAATAAATGATATGATGFTGSGVGSGVGAAGATGATATGWVTIAASGATGAAGSANRVARRALTLAAAVWAGLNSSSGTTGAMGASTRSTTAMAPFMAGRSTVGVSDGTAPEASMSTLGRRIGDGAGTQPSIGVRNRVFSADRRRTRASMTIRSPSKSALRHRSMAQAACRCWPSFRRRSTEERRKLSVPILNAKALSASNWFWVSGV